MRPDFEALSTLAHAGHNLASFRLHAIAPASDCSVEQWSEPVYFDAAETMVRTGALPQRGVVPAAPT